MTADVLERTSKEVVTGYFEILSQLIFKPDISQTQCRSPNHYTNKSDRKDVYCSGYECNTEITEPRETCIK
jgi:hypothetical protein